MLRTIFMLSLAVSGGGALVGCQAASSVATPVILIHMDEFSFEPQVIYFKAGQQARIELTNEGNVPHELTVGRDVEARDGVPWSHKTHLFQGLQVAHSIENGRFTAEPGQATTIQLEAGGKATLTFTVPESRRGEWEMGCFVAIQGATGVIIGTHYVAGMVGKVIVE